MSDLSLLRAALTASVFSDLLGNLPLLRRRSLDVGCGNTSALQPWSFVELVVDALHVAACGRRR